MKKFVSVLTAVLFLGGMALAQNEADVNQTGNGNTTTADQTGTNDAKVLQESVSSIGNSAVINQDGNNSYTNGFSSDFTTGGAGTFIDQFGEDNTANTTQAGSGNLVDIEQGSTTDNDGTQTTAPGVSNTAMSWQQGNLNYSVFQQGGGQNTGDFYIVGNSNSTRLYQALTGNGDDNTSKAFIEGNDNDVLSNQRGYDNILKGLTGDAFRIEGGVMGNGNQVDAYQHGNNNLIEGQMKGNGNMATMEQAGNDHNIELDVEGDNNSATVMQYGNLSGWTEIREIGKKAGTDNDAWLIQRGQGNVLLVEQIGQGNDAYVDQDGSTNESEVLQDGSGNLTDIDQIGDNNSVALATGNNNVTTHNQYGDEDGLSSNMGMNLAKTYIQGSNNISTIEQEGQNDRVNQNGVVSAWHQITGDGNEAITHQDGIDNWGFIRQEVDNNFARQVQDAWNGIGGVKDDDGEARSNTSAIYQMEGNQNHAATFQFGDYNFANIYQKGTGNTAIGDQGIWDLERPAATGFGASHGRLNYLNVYQEGTGHWSHTIQNGNNNTANVTQTDL